MKKLFVILVMTLLGYESINAQLTEAQNDPELLKDPIMPRKKANKVYSLAYARDTFLVGDSPLQTWWRDEILKTINEAYVAQGKSRRVDRSNINWIRDRISYSLKDIGPYMNSGLQDGKPVWFKDENGESTTFGIFTDEEEGIVVILFKTVCMNLVRVPQKVIKTVHDPGFITKIDTIRVPATGTTIVLYNQNFIENSGNSSNTNTNTVSTPASSGTEYVVDNDEPSYQPRPRRVVQPCYDCPIRPRQGAQGFIRLDIGGGRRQQYYPQQPIPQRGYMGGGRQGVGNGNGYMGGGEGNNNGNQGGGRGN